MSTTKEGTHHVDGADPIDLYTKTWIPTGDVKAKLIFIHGFNDHIGQYNAFFSGLAARGIEVHGMDQRGWGKSVRRPSDRGLTGPTTLVISDIVSFIKSQLPSPVPVFVMGHSMGGGEVMTLACDPTYADLMPSVRGWLTESALFGFPPAFKPNSIEVWLGQYVARLLPRFQRWSRIPPNIVTRNVEMQKSIDADPLLHNYGTLQGLSHMLERMDNLAQGKVKLNKNVDSVWISHGSGDLCTSFEASEDWYNAQTIKDKTFKDYKGAAHMLHADTPEVSTEFTKDVGDWILARLDRPETAKL